ncbi:MAG: S8 family serine peptidase [Alphaproteobacteria bacterium]|nr:S8 family serine peptidase [Alphaproteobacteria bacterium]
MLFALCFALSGFVAHHPHIALVSPAMADDDGDDDDDDGGDDDGDDGGDDDGDDDDGGDDDGGGDDDDGGDDGESAGAQGAPGQSSTAAGPSSGDDADDDEANVLGANLTGNEIVAARSLGFVVLRQENLPRLDLTLTTLAAPRGVTPADAIADLNARTIGTRFSANPTYRLASTSRLDADAPFLKRLINWPADPHRCGNAVRIGMLDTHVDRRSMALRRSAIVSKKRESESTKPPMRHGTAVATILVGRHESGFSGIVPDAKLFSAGIFHTNPSGTVETKLEGILVGLDWLLAQRIQVLNLSLAGPAHPLLGESIRRLRQGNVHVVAAAGNSGPFGAPAFPAAYESVIAVTAVDQNRRPYVHANQGDYITLAAPGVGLVIPGVSGKERKLSGTSFSAAIVTGVVAEIVRQQPKASSKGVMRTLQRSALDLGRAGRDRVYGWGLARYQPACGR